MKQPTISQILEKLPPTDKEVQAQAREQQPAEGEKKPAERNPASKFTGPDPEEANRLAAEVFALGKRGVRELLAAVHAPGETGYQNYKAEYLLHTLVLVAGAPAKRKERKLLINALADELGDKKRTPAAKNIFVRELQWIGDSRAAGALGKLLPDDELCSRASEALLAIRDGAGSQFRKWLPKLAGACRITAVQALGALADKSAAPQLRGLLKDTNEDVQLMAAWALGKMGDGKSAPAILELQRRTQGFARAKASEAALSLADSLAAGKQTKEAAQIYAALRDGASDARERHLREAAARCLSELKS